jgi:hypothetical protein
MPETGQLVFLAVAAGVGLLLLDGAIRRTPVGLGLVLGAAALTTTFRDLPYGSMGGFNILLWDAVSTILLCAAVARLLRAREVSVPQWLLIGFGLIVLLALVQGAFQFGLASAVVEFRRFYNIVAIALYFSTVEPRRNMLDRVGRWWLMLAGFLLLLTVLRWVVQPFGLGGWAQGAEDSMRVIGASPTLVLLQGFVIGAVSWIRGDATLWMRRLTPALLAGVVLLQHRTVWAVLLVAVTLLFLRERGAAKKLAPMIVLGVVVVTALSISVLDRGALELTEDLEQSAVDRRTWDWRVEGWQALFEQAAPDEPGEILTGLPFGSGYDRVVNGRVIGVSPHSLYVETYFRTGLLGLALLASLYVTAMRRLSSGRSGGFLSPRTLFLLLVAHPIFFVAYTPGQEQSILLGLGLGVAAVMSSDFGTHAARRHLPSSVTHEFSPGHGGAAG